MAVINAGKLFSGKKQMSVPLRKVPGKIKEALNLDAMYENGMGKIEPGKGMCIYDRCYLFEEINYINKDHSGKKWFLEQLMWWLKSMNVDFKIVITNEYQSIDDFLSRVRHNKNKERYPKMEKGTDSWIREKLINANPNVTTMRYLVVSCRAASESEAMIMLNAVDNTVTKMFGIWQSRIVLLNGEERLKCLHSLLRIGKKEEEKYIHFPDAPFRDWKNDVYPKTIRSHSNFLEVDDNYMSVLFGWKYASAIDPDSCIHNLTNLEFPSFVTMDFAPVPENVIEDKLIAVNMNNQKAIGDEEERKRKHGQISIGPSYMRQRKKDEIEEYMDLLNENDETGFWMNLLVVVTARSEEKLAERVEKLKKLGEKEGVVLETADHVQLKALNTALPFAGRQVDKMRFFLSSSVVAFQPYYAQDVIEPGGYMYGINETTKHLIFGNRKKLMNPHGIIIGHSGAGKSMIIKATEIAQTLLATDDDILILDPQNEFREIIRENGGVFFDLTPKSRICLNGFEVTEEVFCADRDVQEKFVASQVEYATSLMAAIMNGITFTQEHSSVVGKCTRRMFEGVFAQKTLKKQPTLKLLREEIKKELDRVKNDYDENVIRPIYNSMEEYTDGACDMLAHPSTITFDNRLIGFGLRNVPENNWEAVMITVMHYTSSRMEYNQQLRRATHFIVDETQVVSRKGTSANQLADAVATFRKFGGICTMAMQNLTAALKNERLKELFSNCAYKCFLDQGGVDANALSEIQELSQTEFNALSTDEVGHGVMVWGKKVILFDAEISKKNVIYELLSTNFYEKAEQGDLEASGKITAEEISADKKECVNVPDFGTPKDGDDQHVPEEDPDLERAVCHMADVMAVTAGDVTAVCDLSVEEAEQLLEHLAEKGRLVRAEEEGRIRYKRKGA